MKSFENVFLILLYVAALGFAVAGVIDVFSNAHSWILYLVLSCVILVLAEIVQIKNLLLEAKDQWMRLL